MRLKSKILLLFVLFQFSLVAEGRVTLEPYLSIASTKSNRRRISSSVSAVLRMDWAKTRALASSTINNFKISRFGLKSSSSNRSSKYTCYTWEFINAW